MMQRIELLKTRFTGFRDSIDEIRQDVVGEQVEERVGH